MVKRSHDLNPVCRETVVAKQRAAKIPCAHDHGAGGIIVAQEPFQIRNQAVGIIAHLRPAAGADERKVLSDLHIAKPQRLRRWPSPKCWPRPHGA